MVWVFFAALPGPPGGVKRSPFPLAPAPSTPCRASRVWSRSTASTGIETPDVYDREAAKLEILNSYGPTEDKGFVHIPIDQAMTVLAEQAAGAARAVGGAEAAGRRAGRRGESNSGRMFRRGAK